MPEKILFEYAIIRVVPRVEREEFLNIGVILYCQKQGFLEVKYHLDIQRIQAFFQDTDIRELEEHLKAVERICKGGKDAGPIGKMDLASRFRWLTATRSTILQSSRVHPGFCTDAGETLQKLYEQLVL